MICTSLAQIQSTRLDLSSARQRNSSLSFRAADESHANKVAELTGFKDNHVSGEWSDGNRSGHDDAVALGQHEADKASRKKPYRSRDASKKWSIGTDLHLLLIGEHRRVFLYLRYW